MTYTSNIPTASKYSLGTTSACVCRFGAFFLSNAGLEGFGARVFATARHAHNFDACMPETACTVCQVLHTMCQVLYVMSWGVTHIRIFVRSGVACRVVWLCHSRALVLGVGESTCCSFAALL